MKSYFIALFPEEKVSKQIEKFRVDIIGDELVDNLPPHITFKRRFTLSEKITEPELVQYFNLLQLKKFDVKFVAIELMSDALALVGKSPELSFAHLELFNYLEGKVKTKNPEWEGESYKIHLSILRGGIEVVITPDIKSAFFDKLVLYENLSSEDGVEVKELATILLN